MLLQEGCLYIHGGVKDGTGPNCRRTGELLKCWVTVPPLHRMCYDALLHYRPNLLSLTPTQLYHLGVPSLYINKCELQQEHSLQPSDFRSILDKFPRSPDLPPGGPDLQEEDDDDDDDEDLIWE